MSDLRSAILTLGVLTYNRPAALRLVLASLTELELPVLVVDDGSEVETTSVLAGFGEQVSVIRHESNLGYAEALLSLLGACRTEFLLLLNDDSTPLAKGVLTLSEQLARVEFALLKTKRPRNLEARGRGDIGATLRRMSDFEMVQAVRDAPGIIFGISSLRKRALPFLRGRLAAHSEFARIYPQCLLGLVAGLDGQAYITNAAFLARGEGLETGIRDSVTGEPYSSPKSRRRQQQSLRRDLLAGIALCRSPWDVVAILTNYAITLDPLSSRLRRGRFGWLRQLNARIRGVTRR